MIVKEVDLVNIEYPAVDSRKNTGFDRFNPLFYRLFDVNCSDNPVLRDTEGKIYHLHLSPDGFSLLRITCCFCAVVTHRSSVCRVAVERTSRDEINFRKYLCKCTDTGGFCSSLLTSYQYPADTWINGIENQCQFHLVLADN